MQIDVQVFSGKVTLNKPRCWAGCRPGAGGAVPSRARGLGGCSACRRSSRTGCQLSSRFLCCRKQPGTNRAFGSPSLLLRSSARLLHLPGCSWRAAREACGILRTRGRGRERRGAGQELLDGQHMAAPAPRAALQPRGSLRGSWDQERGVQEQRGARQLRWHGTAVPGDSGRCSLRGPNDTARVCKGKQMRCFQSCSATR